MKVSYRIAATLEGTLDEVLAAPCVMVPKLDDVLATMAQLAFVVETIAHLQGKERDLLPTAEKARKLIADLQPRDGTMFCGNCGLSMGACCRC